ncbi:hypothetical protein J3458_011650 [Metarhizium acridum]|uniref:uncharacterized protein n=1 Tax=Metarhizium acridum TaxID=92637 RepID=UPI001C6AE1C4|nr:hypothetical protein J3458_011650 [Metarhizium acridum]
MGSIDDWLAGISAGDNSHCAARTHIKRKRSYPLTPDSACETTTNGMAHPDTPTKRQKRTAENSDWDETPKASLINAPASVSASSSPTKRSLSGRSSSSASSSRRKIQALAVSEQGIIRRQLSGLQTPGLPEAIKGPLRKIISLQRGRQVLSSHCNKLDFGDLIRDFELSSDAFADPGNGGSELSPQDVERIAKKARRCFERDHDESPWNAEVHQDLFETTIRGPKFAQVGQPQLVDFSICTSARLIKEYLLSPAPDQRIDFCFYIDAAADGDYARKVDAIRQELPEKSINQTSYGPHLPYPIFSVTETKRPGNYFDDAMLQLAVFQAAQLKLLRSLLRKAFHRHVQPDQPPTIQNHPFLDPASQYVNDSLAQLGALHNILIQGHQWHYTAISPELQDAFGGPSQKAILWLPELIANTNTELGIHQVSAFIQYMKDELAVQYWVWFKKYILD